MVSKQDEKNIILDFGFSKNEKKNLLTIIFGKKISTLSLEGKYTKVSERKKYNIWLDMLQ